MTTLQMQLAPHFLAPFNEDPMELTSDIDQRAGGADDIEIDLDLTGDNQQHDEDEFMGEEDANALADSTSADGRETNAANDDEMADPSYAQGFINDGSSVRDEDVEDAEYTSPELEEDTVVEHDTNHPNEQNEELPVNYGEVLEEQSHDQNHQEQEYNEHEHHEQPTKPETESVLVERSFLNGRTELADLNYDATQSASGRTSERQHLAISKEATVNFSAADQTYRPPNDEDLVAVEAKLEQVKEKVLPASLGQDALPTSTVAESHTRGEYSSNIAAHLHAIVLDYQGDEMFLFPPVDQDEEHAATFLLADEQLVYGTIGNLLEACRDVLKESLSEQDELMINIHDLDLHISESTIECATTRLSDLVGLYFHLQHNDGLENPPPLYMDLTVTNRFSCRLNILRNASVDGTGLSQLKLPKETEIGQQHGFERETDISNYTTALPINEAYASEQQSGEEAEGSLEQYSSHAHAPQSEILIPEADSGAQATQSYPVKDAVHENHYLVEALLSGDSSARETGVGDRLLSEAAESKGSLETAQVVAGDSEIQKADDCIVDDGDIIDYEDVDDLEGATSSASSTLQGDTIDIHAVQHHASLNVPIVTQNEEHQPPYDVQENTDADGKILYQYGDDKDTSAIVASAEEENPDTAAIPSPRSDDKRQSLSRHFEEPGEVSENDQDTGISQGTESQPYVGTNVQQEASAHYEDGEGSYWQDTLLDHSNQAEGDAYPTPQAKRQGEVEDYSPTPPLDSQSNGSRRIYRDNNLGSVNAVEAGSEPEEANELSAYDDNADDPQLLKEVNSRLPLYVRGSAQTQEDDDEITYEDEEYKIDTCYGPTQASHNVAPSPGLKRARSLHENDDTLEQDLRGSKRVRSESD